ncbi:MAG TPA: hypothetical protein VGL69_21480 [Solirubrobacteraceae bacterium]|jgi:predicted RNA-binding Zn-ribbon protein involved in translation (DUF1610 family)
MTPLALAVAPAPASPGPRYACTACEAEWSYYEVRHVLCCPECGGGLWRHDRAAERNPAQRSGRSG